MESAANNVRGRKPLAAHVRRDQRVKVSFTAGELAELEAHAELDGTTVAELVHDRALAVEVSR
jgi:hypothetical protein